MAATSAADYPTLGFDPTPGDTYEVSAMVRQLSDVSGAMTEISNVLHGAGDGDWRGQAAETFRAMLADDLRPKIDKACTAFDDAHRYISSWSTQLEMYQRRARTLEENAAAAQQKADIARTTLDGLPDAPAPGSPPPATEAEQTKLDDDAETRTSALSLLSGADSDVDGYRQDARRLHDEYEQTGSGLARQLAHAVTGDDEDHRSHR